MVERNPIDLPDYLRRVREGPCFICEFVRGNPDYAHHPLYEDAQAVAFLSKYPVLRGYSLVCPKAHCEDLAEDLSLDAHLHLQMVVYRLARALRRVVPTERVYVLSLGSRQGNRHVHWHVAPLPPGVPYERQQFHALMMEHGVLAIPDDEMAVLARDIRSALERV
jgi:diadenosine tetraphosphate (Ap4A) HIT family hydrolase